MHILLAEADQIAPADDTNAEPLVAAPDEVPETKKDAAEEALEKPLRLRDLRLDVVANLLKTSARRAHLSG
jgi:hypothetical protein